MVTLSCQNDLQQTAPEHPAQSRAVTCPTAPVASQTQPAETPATRRAYGGQTRTGDRTMLATIFMIGLFALAGLFLFKLVFGVGLGLVSWLIGFAIKALIFGAVIYLVVRIFSPETARRLREKFSGSSY